MSDKLQFVAEAFDQLNPVRPQIMSVPANVSEARPSWRASW
jgi:hypothetical protein